MTDKNEEARELEELLSRALEPKGDPPIPLLSLEALGMGDGSKACPGRPGRQTLSPERAMNTEAHVAPSTTLRSVGSDDWMEEVGRIIPAKKRVEDRVDAWFCRLASVVVAVFLILALHQTLHARPADSNAPQHDVARIVG
jgi:hypothetical protein